MVQTVRRINNEYVSNNSSNVKCTMHEGGSGVESAQCGVCGVITGRGRRGFVEKALDASAAERTWRVVRGAGAHRAQQVTVFTREGKRLDRKITVERSVDHEAFANGDESELWYERHANGLCERKKYT